MVSFRQALHALWMALDGFVRSVRCLVERYKDQWGRYQNKQNVEVKVSVVVFSANEATVKQSNLVS